MHIYDIQTKYSLFHLILWVGLGGTEFCEPAWNRVFRRLAFSYHELFKLSSPNKQTIINRPGVAGAVLQTHLFVYLSPYNWLGSPNLPLSSTIIFHQAHCYFYVITTTKQSLIYYDNLK